MPTRLPTCCPYPSRFRSVPAGILASQYPAAGLIPLGISPVGIYADSPVADAKALQGLDLTGIESIGQSWGEIDIEKAAALEPDLIVAEYWPVSEIGRAHV